MKQPAQSKFVAISLIVVIVIVSISIYYLLPKSKAPSSNQNTATPSLTPTPIPLHPGPQTYVISSKDAGIQISKATFDPLDALPGQNQTVTVKASDTTGIASVSAVFMGDEGAKINLPLKLTTGTAKNGTWTGNWLVTLPHTLIYNAAINADNGKKPVTIDLWFR